MEIFSSRQVKRFRIPTLDLAYPWFQILGAVPRDEQWIAVLSGEPGSGKSTLAMQMTNVLPGKATLYNIAEEHLKTGTVQNKLLNADVPAHVFFGNSTEWDSVKQVAGKFRFVFLDSISKMRIPNQKEFFRELKSFAPTSFVLLVQTTKDRKDYRGDAALMHDADILWWMSCAGGQRSITNRKNRFTDHKTVVLGAAEEQAGSYHEHLEKRRGRS